MNNDKKIKNKYLNWYTIYKISAKWVDLISIYLNLPILYLICFTSLYAKQKLEHVCRNILLLI